MSQPDAQEPAVFFHIEALGEVQRIVIAVPSEETTLAELSCKLKRRVALDPHGDGRAALIEALRIADAVELQSGDDEHSPDQTFHQSALVFLDRVVGG